MSKYFKELKFEVPKRPNAMENPDTRVVVDEEKFKPAMKEIRQEMDKIRRGDSELTHYAIDPGTKASPVDGAWKRLNEKPRIEGMQEFLKIVNQDLGAKARDRFKELLLTTLKEVPFYGE